MKNVLVLLHDDAGQEARLQVALDLTRALSGHLKCLDVVVPLAGARDYFDVSEGDGGGVHARARGREPQQRRSAAAA